MITQADMDQLVAETKMNLQVHTSGLVSGWVEPAQWKQAMETILQDAHTQAVYLGRVKAGDMTLPEVDDGKFAALVMDGERQFLNGFLSDIIDGRYTDDGGNLDGEAIGARAEMYSGRLVGTGNEAWNLTLGSDEVWWVLGKEDNCDECPDLADQSPWTSDNLPTVPGANDTPCLFNCGCFLESPGGDVSFSLPE